MALVGAGYTWVQAGTAELATTSLSGTKATLQGLLAMASGQTLVRALFAGGGMAAIGCLISPPALPVIAGLALMEAASDTFQEEYARSRQDDAEKAGRRENRRKQAAAKMANILGAQAGNIQIFGIEHIHMVFDPTTGRTEGRIPTGRYTGHSLHSLSPSALDALRRHAPDTDTADLLTAWQARA